jgi:hypothetical protein
MTAFVLACLKAPFWALGGVNWPSADRSLLLIERRAVCLNHFLEWKRRHKETDWLVYSVDELNES